MNWLPDTCSTSGDTNVESFGDLDQDNLSFYSYLELTPESSPYHLSPLPSRRSYPSTDLETDRIIIDPNLPSDTPALQPPLIQPFKLIIQPNPPPLVVGHNHAEARAQERELVFSELPPELNLLGTSAPQTDNMIKDIEGMIDAARSSATHVPLPIEPSVDVNGTTHVVNAHPTDVNGRLCHGECGPHSCSVCQKRFCKEDKLMRHERSHNKPYVCDICGAVRTWAHHLERHKAIHRDETLTCPIRGCPKTFKTTANMPRHLQNSGCHGLTRERSRQVMADYKRRLAQAT